MFLDTAVLADMMQVSIMQVVDVVTVLDSGVLAVGSMLMIVIFVCVAHRPYSSGEKVSIACMTPLVTKREMCSSASA